MAKRQSITVVGAGLVGSLLATLLGRQGFQVDVFERREDMRKAIKDEGRSINLAVSTRALEALRKVNMRDEIVEKSVPMRGRMIHLQNGETVFQPYSESKEEYLYSISRGELNKILMNAAEETGSVHLHFHQKASHMDFEKGILHLHNEKEGRGATHKADVVLGSDGSGSGIRKAMDSFFWGGSTETSHPYGYKELTIPPGPDGSFLLEKNALHLWPRETFMLLATATRDGSFTCTLFLPFEGENSFEQLSTPEAVETFFEQQFPDVAPLIHNIAETFFTHPIGTMTTVRTNSWYVNDKALLIGDAAHGIVPFFGQGMNAGFEDVAVFDACLQKYQEGSDVEWASLFPEFFRLRKENSDAIADMALENFFEIHNKVGSARFLMEKEVEGILEKSFPNEYFSRYTLVAFTCVPYKVAMDVGRVNQEILARVCEGLKDVSQLNLDLAKNLIDIRVAPLLKNYKKELLLS